MSVDGIGAMTTLALATSQNRELLVALVSYDGPSSSPQTATVTGSGLTWTLVKRSNHQAGTAEIWIAYASDAPETVSVYIATRRRHDLSRIADGNRVYECFRSRHRKSSECRFRRTGYIFARRIGGQLGFRCRQ